MKKPDNSEQLELGDGDLSRRVETISEFTRRIKALVESRFVEVSLRGEISNLRVQASGHVYFSLKDAGAQVAAVMFRGNASKTKVDLRDGRQVVATGEISVYEPMGKYQLIVRQLVEDGVGRLQQEFERLKRQLADEGLFDAERKKSIPRFARRIGIVTSPTGAALQDFLKILERRKWNGTVVVLPAKVQGQGAAGEIARQVAAANLQKNLDLLVVGRGGGSLEDLWAFNEEVLVRAIAASRLPVISAVGHEIDFTLCDFAADKRAETPSAAAEIISSGYLELVERYRQLAADFREAFGRQLVARRERLDSARGHLRLLSPKNQIERWHLRLDDFQNRLSAAVDRGVTSCRHSFERQLVAVRGCSPEKRVRAESQRLLSLYKRLEAASPRSILNRGFAIVRDGEGRAVSRRLAAAELELLKIEFADGSLSARTERSP